MNESKNKIISKNITIKSFSCDDNFVKLNVDNDKNEYIIIVKDGTVNADIVNSNKQMVGLRYLEDGDLVKIKGIKKSDKIIIKKIYIETKYNFDSESSEDLDFY
jgi:hypothetical protein